MAVGAASSECGWTSAHSASLATQLLLIAPLVISTTRPSASGDGRTRSLTPSAPSAAVASEVIGVAQEAGVAMADVPSGATGVEVLYAVGSRRAALRADPLVDPKLSSLTTAASAASAPASEDVADPMLVGASEGVTRSDTTA